MIFLGAGELHSEWIAGIIGVCGDDLRAGNLDNRLRRDLRVECLIGVRKLMEKAPSSAQSTDGEKVKLNTHQRKQLKRARERESSGSGDV